MHLSPFEQVLYASFALVIGWILGRVSVRRKLEKAAQAQAEAPYKLEPQASASQDASPGPDA